MGRYSEEANLYNSGIERLKNTLEEIFLELDGVKKRLEDNIKNQDILTYYVNKFNKDIIEETEDLIAKCERDKVSIMMRAREIDERILLESQEAGLEVGDEND